MKKLLAVVVAVAGLGVRAGEGRWTAELMPDAVGTRATHYWLFDTSRAADDTFLGSINGLDAQQDLWPYKLFAQWNLGRHAFVEGT